jgi:hypothetical protein
MTAASLRKSASLAPGVLVVSIVLIATSSPRNVPFHTAPNSPAPSWATCTTTSRGTSHWLREMSCRRMARRKKEFLWEQAPDGHSYNRAPTCQGARRWNPAARARCVAPSAKRLAALGAPARALSGRSPGRREHRSGLAVWAMPVCRLGARTLFANVSGRMKAAFRCANEPPRS